MLSQRGLLYKKFPEPYKSALVHGGQQLCFAVKEVRSYLSKTSWHQGSQLIGELKAAYLSSAGHGALRILEQSCKTLNDNKEFWLPGATMVCLASFLNFPSRFWRQTRRLQFQQCRVSWKPRCERHSIVRSILGQTNWQGELTNSPPVGPGPKQSAKTNQLFDVFLGDLEQ
ncbi:hypothetical protein FVEG_15380 [Fusarium verticillioides 7600]|uniref:Uncharacterized protein n=1 Tax=Gibberella moniliformis (strain M3125 / FGSC 7600) TaxID=334819 RepID=W7M3A4_GIBM7|nr:hypothetical protein FVEG_15380 [Fusarium verticillioides 7600]EWG42050.1 hypothetical protein FVEG_15380 [Fusarium verticillioides 7600]